VDISEQQTWGCLTNWLSKWLRKDVPRFRGSGIAHSARSYVLTPRAIYVYSVVDKVTLVYLSLAAVRSNIPNTNSLSLCCQEERQQTCYRPQLQDARDASCSWFVDHTQLHTTVGRIPLDEWSARRRDLYPTNKQRSQETDIHDPSGIRTRNPSKQAATDLRVDRSATAIGLRID
jgi:hypothetical protein